MINKMPEKLAKHTIANYKCSRCWGDLSMSWAVDEEGQLEKAVGGEQLAKVVCRTSGEDLGFVSKNFMEKERTRDFDWAFEVKRDLLKMGIITKEKAYGN